MKRNSPTQLPATEIITLCGDQLASRADIMHKMELNALTRGNGCGVLTDEQLADWLNGANVTRHPDDFGAFEIFFGFDTASQDFIVIRSKAPNGLHFAVIATAN